MLTSFALPNITAKMAEAIRDAARSRGIEGYVVYSVIGRGSLVGVDVVILDSEFNPHVISLCEDFDFTYRVIEIDVTK